MLKYNLQWPVNLPLFYKYNQTLGVIYAFYPLTIFVEGWLIKYYLVVVRLLHVEGFVFCITRWRAEPKTLTTAHLAICHHFLFLSFQKWLFYRDKGSKFLKWLYFQDLPSLISSRLVLSRETLVTFYANLTQIIPGVFIIFQRYSSWGAGTGKQSPGTGKQSGFSYLSGTTFTASEYGPKCHCFKWIFFNNKHDPNFPSFCLLLWLWGHQLCTAVWFCATLTWQEFNCQNRE